MTTQRQRMKNREYQAKCRGDKRSYKTELEIAMLLLCRDEELLSEGQIAKFLGCNILDVRFRHAALIEAGMKLIES